MANSYSATFACNCLRKSPIRLTNRSFMLTSQTFMSSRKCEARDLEKGCWTKRCHGVAPREPTRLFSGLVLEADPFIGDVAWLNPRIFASFDTPRVYRARLVRRNRSWPFFRQVRSRLWKRVTNV